MHPCFLFFTEHKEILNVYLQYVFNNCRFPLLNRIKEHLCSRAGFLENAILASEVAFYHIYWVRQNIFFEGPRCPLPEYILVLSLITSRLLFQQKTKKRDRSQRVGYLKNLLIIDANFTEHWYYSFLYKV